jgi:hypothetical protein
MIITYDFSECTSVFNSTAMDMYNFRHSTSPKKLTFNWTAYNNTSSAKESGRLTLVIILVISFNYYLLIVIWRMPFVYDMTKYDVDLELKLKFKMPLNKGQYM